MASTIWNQDLNAGSDWQADVNLTNSNGLARDLIGTTIVSKVKRHHKSISAKETITVVILDETAGKIRLSLTNTQTSNLKDGKYSYDLELNTTATGKVERIIEGVITIRPEVT